MRAHFILSKKPVFANMQLQNDRAGNKGWKPLLVILQKACGVCVCGGGLWLCLGTWHSLFSNYVTLSPDGVAGCVLNYFLMLLMDPLLWTNLFKIQTAERINKWLTTSKQIWVKEKEARTGQLFIADFTIFRTKLHIEFLWRESCRQEKNHLCVQELICARGHRLHDPGPLNTT